MAQCDGLESRPGGGGGGGLAILLDILYAKETGISSVCLGFWLTLTLILTYQKHLGNLVPRALRTIQSMVKALGTKLTVEKPVK